MIKRFIALSLCASVIIIFAGCGGGAGGAGSSSVDASNASGDGADSVSGVSVTLSWNPPTENADGSPLTDLAGYKVYYGTSYGTYTYSVYVGNITTATINDLASGQVCFSTTAFDLSGNESDYSNEACVNI